MIKFRKIENRKKIEKEIVWTTIIEGTNVSKAKKKKEYEYYICDYCQEKIILNKKWENNSGGIIKIRLNDFNWITLALHNRCFKNATKEINEYYKLNI